MAHALTIACGALLVALLIGCYSTRRRADSAIARAARRALLFVVPVSIAAVLSSLHFQWLLATTDIVSSSTTIGHIEAAMARIRLPSILQAILQWNNTVLPFAGLLLLAILPFVKSATPHLGTGGRAAGTLSAVYVCVTLLLTGILLGQGAARRIDAETRRLRAHVDEVVRKAATYKAEIENAAREIVRGELILALDVSGIQGQLDAVRVSIQNAQDEIEPYREILRATGERFEGDTLSSGFDDTWRGIRKTVNDLHWNRRIRRGGGSRRSPFRLVDAAAVRSQHGSAKLQVVAAQGTAFRTARYDRQDVRHHVCGRGQASPRLEA